MATKIKDGLFIGDKNASTDHEFLESNKISNLVNVSGREVPNVWAAHGLVYLTFLWEDHPDFRLFGKRVKGKDLFPQPLDEIVEFIDGSLRHGISVLLFSAKGQSRCVAAACAYLMCRYKWGFEKAYDLVLSRKPDAAPNEGFTRQLFSLDKTLLLNSGALRLNTPGSDTTHAHLEGYTLTLSAMELLQWRKWDTAYLSHLQQSRLDEKSDEKAIFSERQRVGFSKPRDLLDDELLIVNSFLNSKRGKHSTSQCDLAEPKGSSHRRNVTFPEGRQLAVAQDANTIPFTPPSHASNFRRSGILKDSRSEKDDASHKQHCDAKRLIPTQRPCDGGSDLYVFVGMRGEGHTATLGKVAVGTHTQNNLSAEQRLQQMVQSMRGSNVLSRAPAPVLRFSSAENYTSVVAEGKNTYSNGAVQEKVSAREQIGERECDKKLTPSLYDLAYNDFNVTASASSRFDEDPLAAFSMLQLRGGAIRARHDLEVSLQVTSSRRPASTVSVSKSDTKTSTSARMYRQGSPPVPSRRPQSAENVGFDGTTPRLQRRGSSGSVGSVDTTAEETGRRAGTPTRRGWR